MARAKKLNSTKTFRGLGSMKNDCLTDISAPLVNRYIYRQFLNSKRNINKKAPKRCAMEAFVEHRFDLTSRRLGFLGSRCCGSARGCRGLAFAGIPFHRAWHIR